MNIRDLFAQTGVSLSLNLERRDQILVGGCGHYRQGHVRAFLTVSNVNQFAFLRTLSSAPNCDCKSMSAIAHQRLFADEPVNALTGSRIRQVVGEMFAEINRAIASDDQCVQFVYADHKGAHIELTEQLDIDEYLDSVDFEALLQSFRRNDLS